MAAQVCHDRVQVPKVRQMKDIVSLFHRDGSELMKANVPTNTNREYCHAKILENNKTMSRDALAGHVKVATMLLDHGAEINVESDSNKDSPLTFACWKGHCDVVELLLARSANIEHRTKEGFTPLMFAALGGHTDVAAKLLEQGAKVNIPSGSNNDIPLTSACWKGHHDVVKLLLKYTSNIEHRTKDGCTPLMLAARYVKYCVVLTWLEGCQKYCCGM
ncbi:predicted protein [Nematostella vectensis]|uniref:Uncharacterized protein n=1 Tax=Nematostella vectensis TaxID=45351 RepID=A7T774_NEMVE|nr:predicted protein [Nematostella vectensis]|eukprot:XP_001620278.1 hypothetical protein NEMVEDRAFT_v1g223274 [Nematostella vectensis]